MSSFYDSVFLHDHAADEAAELDARRDTVEIEPEQLAEHLAILTDAQFLQFCELVLDAKDAKLRYMVREVICKAVIDKKVGELK